MRPLLAGVLVMFLAACMPFGSASPDRRGHCLVISQFPEGSELARCRIGQDRSFSLSFIHSVSKTRVTDVYSIRQNRIVQVDEYFSAHGAGLPSSVDEPGCLAWETSGDQFVLHMERPIPKLVVRTDRNYENRLIIGSETINLNQWDDQALLLSFSP